MHRARFLVLAVLGLGLGCSTDTRFTEVSPPNGTFTGGEDVELLGSNFPRSGVVVRFGSKPGTGVIVESDHAIKVTTPPGEKGTAADVTLTFDDGRAFVLRNGFRFVDATQQRETMDKFFKKTSPGEPGQPKK